MIKSEFLTRINAGDLSIRKVEGYRVGRRDALINAWENVYNWHESRDEWLFHINDRAKYLIIVPVSEYLAPELFFHYTPVMVAYTTSSPWTVATADRIGNKLAPYRKFWKKEFTAWKRALPAAKRHKLHFFNLCIRAGLEYDEHGGYGSGDYFDLGIIEFVHTKKDLAKYHATGDYLGLVTQSRTRVYAKSSDYRSSERKDRFLVGTNENGLPFVHQVSNNCRTLGDAVAWIWKGAAIEQRQGDVAITASPYKNVEGEEVDRQILGSHWVIGEIKENGSTHVRNAFIYHTKDQHPPIYVGAEWKRIVLGRRSEKGMSSAD